MMQLTLGIICKSVLNYDVESEAEGYSKALTILRIHGKRLQTPLGHVLNKIPILPSVKGAREAKEKLDELVYSLIRERREAIQSGLNSHHDLLSSLLQAQDTGKSGSSSRDTSANVGTGSNSDSSSLGMSDKQARDEVITIFIAGHETTANALTWTFYFLSQNPNIDAKLLEELKSVIGDTRTVTVQDIPKLEYTEKVLRESMRLFPPVWSMSRHVDSDFTLGDFTIPTGSSIVMSQYVMHRNPRYYNEPNRFYPDRWDAKMRSSLPRFSYFPLVAG
jgi:cytochrome P450